MKNKNKRRNIKVSMGIAHGALIRALAEESKNDLEKFLIQQNLVQYLLIQLIESRSKSPDKNFFRWIERSTLGVLIEVYKVCAFSNKTENLLIRLLEKYNEKRNYLIHKIIKDSNYKEIENKAKEANRDGLNIIKLLEKLVRNELDKKIAKIGRLVANTNRIIEQNKKSKN